MIPQQYAPLVFSSLSQLEEALRGIKSDSSYLLASARLPQAVLQTRAIGKFHLFTEEDKPDISALAQIELADVSQPQIAEMYRNTALDIGYGRISIVPAGGMTHDFEANIDAFLGMQEQLAVLKAAEKEISKENPNASLRKLFELQSIVHNMSDLRTRNGFSVSENRLYGDVAMLCCIFSAHIQPAIGSELIRGVPKEIYRIVQGMQVKDTLGLMAEVRSDNGVNRPVYFSPRVTPEVAELVLR